MLSDANQIEGLPSKLRLSLFFSSETTHASCGNVSCKFVG